MMEVEQAKIEEFEVKNECHQEDVPGTMCCLHLNLIRKCFGEKVNLRFHLKNV